MLCLLHCFSCRLTRKVVPLFLETPHQFPTVTHPHSGILLVHNGPLLVQATSTHYCPHTGNKLEGLTFLTRLMQDCRSGKSPLPEAKRSFPIQLSLTKMLLGRSGHQQTMEQGTHFHVITKKTYFGNFLPFKQIIFVIV